MANCKRDLDILRNHIDADGVVSFDALKVQLVRLLAQKEGYWRQRAKLFWLNEGDSNTRFFHASVNARRWSNKIVRLKDDFDLFFDESWELCRIAKNYFKNVFSPSSGDYDSVLNVVDTKISVDDNVSLLTPFTKAEFYLALKQMHLDKAPGPDGFGPAFYQIFWELTGDDIFREGVSWLEQGMFLHGLMQILF